MKFFRWEISRMGLNIANYRWTKRIKMLLNPRYYKMKLPRESFLINVCNFCNLKCYSCSSLCDKPFNNAFRDKPRIQSLEDIEKFVKLIYNWYPNRYIRLSGGEPTMVGTSYLYKIVDILHKYNRKVSLLTNGYLMDKIDPYRFEQIILDNHSPLNKEFIDRSIKHLEKSKYDNWEIWYLTRHIDLDKQRENNISMGLNCPNWINTISLWKDIIYPCCNMQYLEGWDNNSFLTKALRNAGWNVNNPYLINTIENWRTTIPSDIIKTCLLSCWVGGPIKWVSIKNNMCEE